MDRRSQPIRIVIADDHPIFRDGLRRLLEAEPGLKVIGEAPAEARYPAARPCHAEASGVGGLAGTRFELRRKHGSRHLADGRCGEKPDC